MHAGMCNVWIYADLYIGIWFVHFILHVKHCGYVLKSVLLVVVLLNL